MKQKQQTVTSDGRTMYQHVTSDGRTMYQQTQETDALKIPNRLSYQPIDCPEINRTYHIHI